jgi:hypothetical protein
MNIRDVSELHRVLEDLSREHVTLRAPDEQGLAMKWFPCSMCDAVCAVPVKVASFFCEDCAAPCAHADCGLRVFEHKDGCEPIS